jgi:hypothetical protein
VVGDFRILNFFNVGSFGFTTVIFESLVVESILRVNEMNEAVSSYIVIPAQSGIFIDKGEDLTNKLSFNFSLINSCEYAFEQIKKGAAIKIITAPFFKTFIKLFIKPFNLLSKIGYLI